MQQRLFEIVWLLTERDDLTAGQLAQRFGVSRRTIYRDIDALSSAGVPVYAEKGRGGGLRLLPGFVMDKSMLTESERTQLVAHFESLSSLGTPDTDALLDKLSAFFGRGDSWLEVDFAPWGNGAQAREVFRLLRDAILARHVVTFSYSGEQGESARAVQPVRIVFRGQAWYLHAYCLTRQDFRIFKLNRMKNVEDTGETFQNKAIPPSIDPPYTGPVVHAKILFSPALAFRAVDEFSGAQLTRQPDGSFLVEGDFPTNSNWLVGYILSFGAGATVLEPPELRQAIAGQLRQMNAHYQEN